MSLQGDGLGSDDARRFKRGEHRATLRIRRRVRRILAFRGYGISAEERLDLEQAILLQLWEAVARPQFDGSGFWGLVEVITSRRCIDWFRTHRTAAPLELIAEASDPRADPLAGVLRRERTELAEAVIAELPRKCRELLRLRLGLGKSYREIAETLDASEGALRVQMHRCVQRASRLLESRLEADDDLCL